MPERWMPVVGHEGTYEVSTSGRIRSIASGRILTAAKNPKTGYMQVWLYRDGRRHVQRVHRVVLEAFVGSAPADAVGCHNDGNPLNNALSNLRWDTQKANIRDSVRQRTHRQSSKTHCSHGHPFTPENTYTKPGTEHRECRECRRAISRAHHERTHK